ncbi:hypothetical protein JCM10213_008924 [Rhodosporidiobolus nylandii]
MHSVAHHPSPNPASLSPRLDNSLGGSSSASARRSPLFAPSAGTVARTVSPLAGEMHPHPPQQRRDSSGSTSSTGSSQDDESPSYSHSARTSPDLSSLTPTSFFPSSPKRAPGLSPSQSPSLSATRRGGNQDEDEEDDVPITSLPSRVPRPKNLRDCRAEAAGGVKKEGLGKKLARKRADSLKWAKYANVGTFEIELGLSNDDLMRK